MAQQTDHIAAIRRFSRTYTGQIGVLDEHFLGLDRPLGESRLLYEIGLDGATIAALRERLGLDSGYTSRLIRRLESDGLVDTVADAADGRRRRLVLTTHGRAAWAQLDDRSVEHIERLVAPLGPRRTAQLAEALDRAERLVRSPGVRFAVVDARLPEAQTAVATYFAELEVLFTGGFDPGDSLQSDCPAFDPPSGAFVLARIDDEVVGCGGLWTIEAGVGEIKRMWIAPAWRGVGLAARLLTDLEARSRAIGHQRTVLDTNEVLHDAIAMYERAGYTAIERYNDNPYAHHWFEKRWDRR